MLLDLVEELSCGAQIYHSKLVRAGSTRQSNSLLVGHTLLMWFERNKQKPMNVETLGKGSRPQSYCWSNKEYVASRPYSRDTSGMVCGTLNEMVGTAPQRSRPSIPHSSPDIKGLNILQRRWLSREFREKQHLQIQYVNTRTSK